LAAVTSVFQHCDLQLSASKPWSDHMRYVGTMIAFGAVVM